MKNLPPPFSRRAFLHGSALASLAAAIGPLRIQAESSDLPAGLAIKKSLKWGMIRVQGSVLDKFRLLRSIGFDGVELDSPGGVDKAEALQASQETGLPIEGIVNATHWNVRHSDPDPKVRAQARVNLGAALRDAKLVGADSVLLVPGKVTDPETENHDQVWRRSIADIHEMIPLAEELQVRILIENVGNGFCADPHQFAAYIDAIDSPWVGVHFDIGNHIWQGPPAEWIRILGSRIRKLDVKDRSKGRERRKIGEGDADWPAVRQALKELGYRGWAAAEVEGGDAGRLREVLRRMNEVLEPSKS